MRDEREKEKKWQENHKKKLVEINRKDENKMTKGQNKGKRKMGKYLINKKRKKRHIYSVTSNYMRESQRKSVSVWICDRECVSCFSRVEMSPSNLKRIHEKTHTNEHKA